MGGTIALELALQHPKLVRSLTLACTWAEADARFLHTIESWISLAYRVPVEERYRHVVYPWLFTPDFFARKENVETAFQRAMAYPHQTKPEAIERQAKGIVAWNGTRVKRLSTLRVPTLVMVGKDDILTPAGVLQGAGPADSTRQAHGAAGWPRLLPRARRSLQPRPRCAFSRPSARSEARSP